MEKEELKKEREYYWDMHKKVEAFRQVMDEIDAMCWNLVDSLDEKIFKQ